MDSQNDITPHEPAEDAPATRKSAKRAAAAPTTFTPLELKPRILVMGVGGGGGNAVNNMIDQELAGVEFVAANTDAQALTQSRAQTRVQLGRTLTGGLGAGGDATRGAEAAEESAEELTELMTGANMVFIAGGLGGGTGTGAGPVIARIARACGALTVCVVTKPFLYEGGAKMRRAEEGLRLLSDQVDAEIVIPNQSLYNVIDEDATFVEAFREADEVLHQGVRSITDLMVRPGHVNLDFADVRAVMQDMGPAIMGAGEATGENRALIAAEAAINNPLFDEVSVRGARSVLVNVASDGRLAMREIDAAVSRVRAEALDDAFVASGISIDPALEGRIRVSVVATGVSTAVAAGAGPRRVEPARRVAPTAARAAPAVRPQEPAPQPQTTLATQPQPQPAPQPAPQPLPETPIVSEEPQPAPRAVDAPPAPTPADARASARSPLHHMAPASPPASPEAGPREAIAKRPPPLSARRPLGSGALPKTARRSGIAEGPPMGAALGNTLAGEPPAQEPARGSSREGARVDAMDVDIPDFLRRHASP